MQLYFPPLLIAALWGFKLFFYSTSFCLPTLSLWICLVSSSKRSDLTKLALWSERGVCSSVSAADRTLRCVSGVCPGGRSWRGCSAVNSVYSSTLSLFDKWEPRLIPTLHAITHPAQHFNAQAKIDLTFLKTGYPFTARLQSPLLSLPLRCIDFLLKTNKQTKKVSFLPQLWQQSQGRGIYLLLLHTMAVEQFSPPSTSIYLPDIQSGVTGSSAHCTSTHQSL